MVKERQSREQLQQAWLESGRDQQERAHGEFPIVKLYSDQYVKLSQIRGGKNRVSQRLKESILSNGLYNMSDSASVSPELLADYIAFTNRTWGAEASIDDFKHLQRPEGHYQLMVAGNSRHEAVDDLEQEGLLPPIPFATKDHEVHTVFDIINIQREENVHSTPTIEREALAVVEAYRWGVEQGDWSNEEEFLKKYEGPKVSSKTFRDALCFEKMPRDVMMFALTGNMSFAVGVEIGKSIDTLRDHTAVKMGYEGTGDSLLAPGSEDAELLEKALYVALMAKASHIAGSSMNAPAAKKHVEAWRAEMDSFLVKERAEEPVPTLELRMVTPRQQAELYLRSIENDSKRILKELARKPGADYMEIIRLNEKLVGRPAVEELHSLMEQQLVEDLSALGHKGLNGAAIAEPGGLF